MSLDSHVASLRSKHADADRRVLELERSPSADTSELSAAKKRKLAIKDQIEQATAISH